MVASEPLDIVVPVTTTEGAEPPPVRVHGRARLVLGIVLVIAGIIVTWLALDPLGDLDGVIKVPLTIAGVGMVLAGIDRICKFVWGSRFDTGFWLSTTWVIGLTAAAALADFLPLAEHTDTTKTISEPGNLRPDLFSEHPLGTNNFSLDLLAQSIYGARVSLLTSVFAVFISMIIGGIIGMIAGYFRGVTDTVIGVFGDSLLAFPALILLVALAAVFGIPTTVPEAIGKSGVALAIVGIPTMMRLSRANTMVFAQREFVLASRGMGATDRRIIFRELLPNVILPIVSYSSIIVAVLIIAEGSLSFLGLGLQQPKPTWGNMIAEADLTTLRDDPHIALVPGMFMFITVYSFNRIGERARSKWDPREVKI